MSARLVRVVFAVFLAAFVGACGKQESAGPVAAAGASTPEATIRRSADLLKQGDLAGLLQNALPPADFAELKADWTKHANEKPVTDEDRRKFQETMAKLTAQDADKKLFAEIEPDLKRFDTQYQQQMPMYVAMGSGWLQGMVQQNKELSEADKQQALAAINALAAWVQKTRFTDPDSVRKVLAIATRTARELNLKTLDEARALGFDQSMQKASIALKGFKEALAVYGFSIDGILDSVKPEAVSNDGKASTTKVTYELLGTPLSTTVRMVNVDGRWYGKDTIERMNERREEAAAAPPAPAPDAPPPEAAGKD
ncbi:MAG TPA: hypothetical protein VHE32_11815 [Rhodanobacteraceae bacterium]|jgi:hypothetical protein|nr:hypothetical protein [Rhodanobacteraceae bacterium]